jgi:hypothetical protein
VSCGSEAIESSLPGRLTMRRQSKDRNSGSKRSLLSPRRASIGKESPRYSREEEQKEPPGGNLTRRMTKQLSSQILLGIGGIGQRRKSLVNEALVSVGLRDRSDARHLNY